MLGLGLEGIELHSDADVGEIHEVPMQRVMFPHVVDLAPQPLRVTLTVGLHRVPKTGKCAMCGLRRVRFTIGIADVLVGPALCAACAGIR